MDSHGDLASTFHKGDNFCDFPFAFLHISPLLKWIYSIRKEFAPKGSTFFPFEVDPFCSQREQFFSLKSRPLFKKGKKQFWKSYLPWKCIHSPWGLSRMESISGLRPALEAQSDACPTGDPVAGSIQLGPAIFFCGDLPKNIFYIILSLLLIQERQLSVSGERMCTNTW